MRFEQRAGIVLLTADGFQNKDIAEMLTLRCQKVRKKRHTGRTRKGSIPNQVSFDLRPAMVAERARFGDWEVDLVIVAGRNRHWSRLTRVPRATP